MNNSILTLGNETFNVSDNMGDTILNILDHAKKGAFFSVKGYSPDSNWTIRPVQNIVAQSEVSKFREEQIDFLSNLKFEDITIKGEKLEVLSEDEQRAQFSICIEKKLQSLQKTLNDVREDAHRQAHDRNYVKLSEGVKLHLKTAKDSQSGKMEPVMENGRFTIKSIMITYINGQVKTIEEGERKVVNSGKKVLMDKCIDKTMPSKFILKTLSLKADNFESLSWGGLKISTLEATT